MLPQLLLALGVWFSSTLAESDHCTSAHARTRVPRGAIAVDGSGKIRDAFTTIAKAIDALDKETVGPQAIFIYPGVYEEQVYIPPLLGPLSVHGWTCNTHRHAENEVAITYNASRLSPGVKRLDQTATVRVWSPRVKLYNLNITNDFGPAFHKGQAAALSAQATELGVYSCSLKSWEDTLYANVGRQLYAKTYINGAVDFILGTKAIAWFEACDIVSVDDGWITAHGRESPDSPSFFVFDRCHVSGKKKASTYLGRPWGPYPRVVFQESHLGDVVNHKGWSKRGLIHSDDENIFFGEFLNNGPASAWEPIVGTGPATGKRVNFAKELPKELMAIGIMGPNWRKEWWVDQGYLRQM
ncbi:hypothetical protein AK830_g1394 [Neonectria ditissima]|uniref:pectinesterase n=1 Tax=Neonectria ditissima TaxID=78410 RepID=A0A0N8H8Q5_9HYPO|nr:hypothetical protein AK830_g1394 [Neonectria ditissima]